MALHKAGKETEKKEMSFEVLEECGVIGARGKGELKLRYMAWNGQEPKYYVNPWYTDKNGEEKCYQGISFTGEELESLYRILKQMVEE